MDVSASRVDGYGWRVGGRAAYRINLETFESRRSRARGRSTPTTSRRIRRTTCTARPATASTCGSVDAKTLQVAYYDIPATAAQRRWPRRRHAARQGRQAEPAVVGWLRRQLRRHARSPRPAGKQLRSMAMPARGSSLMTRTMTMRGYTWTGGIYADRVARLNVETGEWSYYLLPFEANIRDINLQPAARRRPLRALDRPHPSGIDHAHRALGAVGRPKTDPARSLLLVCSDALSRWPGTGPDANQWLEQFPIPCSAGL